MHDHTRTMTFSSDSLLIRLYMWAWEPARSPDFCKLFWGTFFLPMAAFLHALFGISKFVNDHLPEQIEEEDAQCELMKKLKAEQGPGFFQNLLTNIGGFFDKVAAFFQNHEWVGVAIMAVVLGVVSVGILGGLVLLIIEYPLDVLYAVLWVVGTAVALGIIIALGTYLDKTGKAKKAGVRTAQFFKRVRQFLSTGYHAVKYRTCPAIVIEDPTKV